MTRIAIITGSTRPGRKNETVAAWVHQLAVKRGAGGARAVEHLRQIVGSLHVADVRNQVVLTLATDFENYTDFRPAPHQEASLTAMLDQVVAWSGALKPLRARDTVSVG
jgi:NAD(P)H-dependent FMN reductase